ncbi:MAG: hypothetical protein WCP06_13735 [Verrucomicrobiota bacterium]
MQNHKNIAASLSRIIKSWLLCPALAMIFAASAWAVDSVPAYFYPSDSGDVPAMSAAMPAVVTEVYFKAAQMFGGDTVSAWPRLPDGFYPDYWSPGAVKPLFTAAINSDANYTFSTTTAAVVQDALTARSWTNSFTGGLTVDSELNFVVGNPPPSLGGNMKAFMTSMCQFSNDAGKSFSFYLGARYLGSDGDPNNPAYVKDILGTMPASPQNYLLMPTYIDGGGPDSLGRLTTAVSALSANDVAYKWILEIDSPTDVFQATVSMLVDSGNGLIDPAKGYSGIALYQFIPGFDTNPDITANLLYLNGHLQEFSQVPEAKTVCLLLAALAALLFFRKFSAAKE